MTIGLLRSLALPNTREKCRGGAGLIKRNRSHHVNRQLGAAPQRDSSLRPSDTVLEPRTLFLELTQVLFQFHLFLVAVV